ncbi:MAG: lytic transglycosylase domain-containing protein [Ferruginibacter sp.]
MSIKSNWSTIVSRSVWILFFSITTGSFAKGNPYIDTTKKLLLASADKKDKADYITKEANIVFPKALSGNEEESLDYIEKFSANRRAYIIRTYNRSTKYFPKVSAIFSKYDLPHELKVLMALESAFNANAVSRAGAVGYWQFMDEVAREYGLKYTVHKAVTKKKHSKKIIVKTRYTRDDRRNFNKSTCAAARYLKDRGRNLDNDLLLMVASYNCGVGNVWEAMKKTRKDNPTFWDIKNYLPAETRAYVMNFITLNVVFHNYDKFANNTLTFKPVKVKLEDDEDHMTDTLDETTMQK